VLLILIRFTGCENGPAQIVESLLTLELAVVAGIVTGAEPGF
jgi:hypothetical protein